MSFTDPSTPEHPYQPPSMPGDPDDTMGPPDLVRLVSAVLWIAFLLIAGGGLVGYTVLEFGEYGMFAVWPLGWVGGCVASKILGGKSKPVGVLLVVACFGVSVMAEVIWIHAKFPGGDESWVKAISLLPAFIQRYKISAFTALLFSAFGAMSAWRQVAVRYAYVRVRIDD